HAVAAQFTGHRRTQRVVGDHADHRHVVAEVRQRHADIGLGAAGFKSPRHWEMKREMLSLRATTRWDELATVHAR
ncbi:MAG: DUF4113 domain-containing protein, partial [Aurantimicrobium sp.]